MGASFFQAILQVINLNDGYGTILPQQDVMQLLIQTNSILDKVFQRFHLSPSSIQVPLKRSLNFSSLLQMEWLTVWQFFQCTITVMWKWTWAQDDPIICIQTASLRTFQPVEDSDLNEGLCI